MNGLFDIDDTKDSDSTNTHGKDGDGESPTPPTPPKQPTPRERLIARLKEKGIDTNAYAKEHNLTPKTPPEEFERLLKELG